jgi:hypothetical protein
MPAELVPRGCRPLSRSASPNQSLIFGFHFSKDRQLRRALGRPSATWDAGGCCWKVLTKSSKTITSSARGEPSSKLAKVKLKDEAATCENWQLARPTSTTPTRMSPGSGRSSPISSRPSPRRTVRPSRSTYGTRRPRGCRPISAAPRSRRPSALRTPGGAQPSGARPLRCNSPCCRRSRRANRGPWSRARIRRLYARKQGSGHPMRQATRGACAERHFSRPLRLTALGPIAPLSRPDQEGGRGRRPPQLPRRSRG